LVANTQWDVVADSTVCVGATQPRTGVNALLVSASQLRGAVRVELALWPAVRRLAYHAGLARAVTAVTVVPRRVGVGPTGVGVAGVFFNDRSDWKGLQSTCSERVSDVVGDAGASWAVASHLALCIDATSSRAWVDALVPLACFVGGAVRMDHTLRPTSHIWVTKVFRNALA